MHYPCYELALNTMVHGKGGTIEIYYADSRTPFLKTIKAICIDRGQGIDDFKALLKKSKAVHKQNKKRRFADVLLDTIKGKSIANVGLRNIVYFPDYVSFESNGKKWLKVMPKKLFLRLKVVDDSEVQEGVKTTLVWYKIIVFWQKERWQINRNL